MARAYTPGLRVAPRTRHRVERLLPIPGDVTVTPGDQVGARQIVARTSIPGDITPLNMASLLGVPPADVPDCMLRKEGDRITEGEVIARTRGIFGMFQSERKASVGGTIEAVSSVTGQVIVRGEPLPLELGAYLAGYVTGVIEGEGCVIEADVTLIQGIFGIGGETHGPIRLSGAGPGDDLTADRIHDDMGGAVVVGGARVRAEALTRARGVGVAALVVGGIDDADLRSFLGYDLGVAITGSETAGLTLVLTEGFGDIAMAERTFSLLTDREGHEAAVNGATQIRAGVMRPEVIIPFPDRTEAAGGWETVPNQLEIGKPVRIVREPWFGRIGSVSGLPHELQVLESGARARVLEVRFATGESVIIPRANVELIES